MCSMEVSSTFRMPARAHATPSSWLPSNPLEPQPARRAHCRHAVLLLTSTIGFPAVVAAMTWADDVLESEDAKA